MNTENNKALIKKFFEEVWGKGNFEVTKEIFAENYVRHDLRSTVALSGSEGQAKIASDFRRAFPDLRIEIDLIVAENDMVATRWTMEGTNLNQWGNIKATNKHARFSGANFFRFSQEKVVEIWNIRDDLGLMQQIGVPVFAGAVSNSKSSKI